MKKEAPRHLFVTLSVLWRDHQSPTSNPAWAELRNWLNIYSATERKQMIRALSFDVIQNAAGICANRVRRTVPACMDFMSIGASFAMISGVAAPCKSNTARASDTLTTMLCVSPSTEGRRSVASASARCRAPDPHANAHRYSVWVLPERGRLE